MPSGDPASPSAPVAVLEDGGSLSLKHQSVHLRLDSSSASSVDAITVLKFETKPERHGTHISTLPSSIQLHARYLRIQRIQMIVPSFTREGDGNGTNNENAVDCKWELRDPPTSFDKEMSVKTWTLEHWKPAELDIYLPSDVSEYSSDSLQISIEYRILPYNENGGRNPGFLYIDSLVWALPVRNLRLARYWVPCLDDLTSLVKWDLYFYLCNIPTILSSGHLVSDELLDGTRQVHYTTERPLPAGMIGFLAGDFELGAPIPSATNMTQIFCPRSKSNRLPQFIEFISRAFHFHNWYLTQGSNGVAIDFPFSSLSFAFSRHLPAPVISVCNVVLLSMELLADSTVMDQIWETRRAICEGLAWQYWWAPSASAGDAWLPVAIREFMVRQQLRIFHGHNDYRFNNRKDLQRVLDYEARNLQGHGYALHDPQRSELEHLHPSTHCRLKSVLVLNLLEQRLGKANFQRLLAQVYLELQQFISSIPSLLPNSSHNSGSNPLNTVSFFKTAKRLTGKDLRSFIEQWVYANDPLPRYNISFAYNRTKNVIQVNVEEELKRRLHGSVLIRVHEGEGGTFDHVVHVDEPVHHFELPYHTKTRKQRVPKVKAERTVLDSINPPPLRQAASTPSQDGGDASSGTPTLAPIKWIRIDPDNEWLACFGIQQTDTQLADQLEYDRDVVAQFEACLALQTKFLALSESTLASLERVILDPKIFYPIRCLAALSLSNSVTVLFDDLGFKATLGNVNQGTPMPQIRKLLEIYAKRHAHRDLTTNEVMPRANNFDILPNYFVQCAMIEAISSVREANNSGKPLDAIIRFLTDFLRLNDNTLNGYSDAYYLVALMKGLAEALPGGQNLHLVDEGQGQIERYARKDRILPSHRNIIMQTVIRYYHRFQAAMDFYTNPEHHWEVRRESFAALLKAGDPPQLLQDNWQLYYACIKMNERCLSDGNLGAEALILSQELETKRQTAPEPATTATLITPMEPSPVAPVETDWLSEMTGERTPVIIPTAAKTSVITTTSAPGTLRLRLALKHSMESVTDDNKEWNKVALEALDAVWNSPDSYPFRYPVDPAVPNYYNIIRQPMDLSTIRGKIEANAYQGSLEAFLRDLRLIFDNCAIFNLPGSPIVRQSQHLSKHSIRELKIRFPYHGKLIKQILKGKANNPVSNGRVIEIEEEESNNHQNHQQDDRELEEDDEEREINVKDDVHQAMNKELTFKQMHYLWNKLMEHPDSFWFREPVDAIALELPNYHQIVQEPMDLGSIGQKILSGLNDKDENDEDDEDSGRLSSYEFIRLVLLVFDNCRKFNPPHTLVHVHGLQLKELFLAWLQDPHLLELAEKLSPLASRINSPVLVVEDQPNSLHLPPPPPTPSSNKISLTQEQRQLLIECIDDLMVHPCSEPFNTPVDYKSLGLPLYPKIIKRPMDFSTIRTRLLINKDDGQGGGGNRRMYQKMEDFIRDIQQVFANCVKFNGPTADISEWAKQVQEHFEHLWLPRLR